VNGAISDGHYHHTSTNSLIVHDQVQSKILYKKSTVVGKRPAKQCMEHSMTCSIGDGATSDFDHQKLSGIFCLYLFEKKASHMIRAHRLLLRPLYTYNEWRFDHQASRFL
jgi:hypothetical protein